MGGRAGRGRNRAGQPCEEDGATTSCCREGTHSCKDGVWSACEGAYLSNESCNGIDDDCDGEIDELGTFSCGIGACARTISACDGGVLGVCLPAAPAATSDGCNDVDDDCDGAVDEDCPACVHVATTGDDAAAAASNGATPFATVQAAIDFADAHREGPARVCVAPGATCGMTATFAGPTGADLTMRNGISVLANYESTTWTRCLASTTRLTPQTGRGVVFPASISTQTVLDGFAIDRFLAETSAGVTVDGGRGVLLSNLSVLGGPPVSTSYGVNVINGGQATVFQSRIDNGGQATVGIAVRAVGSQVAVEDSCPVPPDATGRCVPPCLVRDSRGHCNSFCSETQPGIRATYRASTLDSFPQQIHGVVLEDSPGSRIERSAICTSYDVWGAFGENTAVRVAGDASGTVLRANAIRLDGPGPIPAGSRPIPEKDAIRFSSCRGAAPWLIANESIEAGRTEVDSAVASAGDCHPVIEGNSRIEGKTNGLSAPSAIRCSDDSGVPSRCVITNNALIQNLALGRELASTYNYYAIGVDCRGRSCARIDENSIAGIIGDPGSISVGVTGVGISTGGATIVSGNQVTGNCSRVCKASGFGISASAAPGLMDNNEILGSCVEDVNPWCGTPDRAVAVGLRITSSETDEWIVRSNSIRALTGSACSLQSCYDLYGRFREHPVAVSFTGTTGVFQENVFSPGYCGDFSFFEAGSGEQHPRRFENNHFAVGYGSTWTPSPLYHDTLAGDRLTPADIDALTDMAASGTTADVCQ